LTSNQARCANSFGIQNADEWQYVIEGDLSLTMFGLGTRRFRTEQLHAGDVGLIPQGYGHSIETSRAASRMLIGLTRNLSGD